MSVEPPLAPPAVANAFTVDLEDWFQGLTSTNPLIARWPTFESRVVAATEHLLALLRENNVTATFFVLGYVADRHPALIEAVAADGHEIGIHGYYHRFVYRLSPDAFRAEIADSIAAVQRITGRMPLGHRAPYFSINAQTPWALPILQEFDLQYDSSVFPIRNMLYGFPGAPRRPYRVPDSTLVEFPASTARFGRFHLPIAGGFYNRVLPYAVIREGIRRLNAQGHPAILYVHPWELDTGQRYRKVTARERVTHYFGRRTLRGKLERLFDDFAFAPLATLTARFNQAEAIA